MVVSKVNALVMAMGACMYPPQVSQPVMLYPMAPPSPYMPPPARHQMENKLPHLIDCIVLWSMKTSNNGLMGFNFVRDVGKKRPSKSNRYNIPRMTDGKHGRARVGFNEEMCIQKNHEAK